MLLSKVKEDFLKLLADEIQAVSEEEPEPVGEGEEEEKKAEPPKLPVFETSYKEKGFHLDVTVPVEKSVPAAEILNNHGFFIEAATGVDYIKEGQLEVVYDFSHFAELCRIAVKIRMDRENPVVPTISGVFPGADWHERETHDFFGIKFEGLENLGPFLLPEDADFHPLLKDFSV